MQVFDEINKEFIDERIAKQLVVGQIPGQLIIGWTRVDVPVTQILFWESPGFNRLPAYKELLGDNVTFSNRRGCYMSKVDVPMPVLIEETETKGQGRFPYRLDKKYEACENFDKFTDKQHIINKEKTYCLSHYLKYSFGLEFETSQGYVPEDLCFRDGLIPLRDGSISGIEYSTVVLSGNDGLALLEQQVKSLKKYTDFNKECSLHVHFGGFPLNSDKLFNLYKLCKSIESELNTYVPKYTFNTSLYKANEKNYCNPLSSYRSFNQMYEHLVGRKFFNDFTQPHPNDIARQAKWRIPTRYYWINFINALCYDVNKTIEFRFLRPTYNFQKIILWLYIFNALLIYAEQYMDQYGKASLSGIVRTVYPNEIAERIIVGLCKLSAIVTNQTNNGDLIGQNVYMEEEVFSDDLGI